MARVRVGYRTTERAVYNRFCLAYPETKISYDKWKEIIYTYNYSFRDYILETGDKVRYPWGFGTFAISKKKTKATKEYQGKTYVNLPVDWKKTKELGKKIYTFNAHTDGFRCKWMWFPKEARFFQSEVWYFKPSRLSSRRITEYIKKPHKQYLKIYKEWARKK